MAQHSIATPAQNYVESEDLVFEIGDEEPAKKKRGNDDRIGFGHEAESSDDDFEGGEEFDDFSELGFTTEEDDDFLM